MTTAPSIFDLFREMRKRPGMYLGNLEDGNPLDRLLWLLVGYQQALHVHGIEENPRDFLRAFSAFVREKTGWATANLGAIAAIADHFATQDQALAAFWDFVDEYEKSMNSAGQ